MTNQLLCNNSSHGGSLKDAFKADIGSIQSLQIASGYFGESLITEFESKLVKIAKKGGTCKILIGMIFHKGVSVKQGLALKSLDKKLRSIDPENGVYISQKEYHGKIYLLKMDSNESVLYIGSSNFSSAGFKERLEATLRLDDSISIQKTTNYLDYLFKLPTTSKLDDVSLERTVRPIKGTSNLLDHYKINCSDFPDESRVLGTFEIKLRVDVQKESSLNLYFGAGRKNKGKFSPRPWYEIELSAQKSERKNPLYPVSTVNGKHNSRLGEFTAYIKDCDFCYKLEMKVHSDFGKNISSSERSGGRQTLGRYIKGKLEDAGVLKFAERITSDMLEEYGRSSITFKKIDDRTYIIEF